MDSVNPTPAQRLFCDRFTLEEMAKRAGYSVSHLSDVAAGKTGASPRMIAAIAKALKITTDEVRDAIAETQTLARRKKSA